MRTITKYLKEEAIPAVQTEIDDITSRLERMQFRIIDVDVKEVPENAMLLMVKYEPITEARFR